MLSEKTRSILDELREKGTRKNIEGMARFGINPDKNLGVSVTQLRKYAKRHRPNHALALELWDAGYRDARMLASMVDHPAEVTEEQMDRWASEFNSWDITDTATGTLFDKTPFAYPKAEEWAHDKREFVRRAGFALMAWLAVHDKNTTTINKDDKFRPFIPLIIKYSTDPRNFVKKAVSWALRQIGKRNKEMNKTAVNIAEQLLSTSDKTSKWIARTALKELTSEKVQDRLK